jgi:hypothetical protein
LVTVCDTSYSVTPGGVGNGKKTLSTGSVFSTNVSPINPEFGLNPGATGSLLAISVPNVQTDRKFGTVPRKVQLLMTPACEAEAARRARAKPPNQRQGLMVSPHVGKVNVQPEVRGRTRLTGGLTSTDSPAQHHQAYATNAPEAVDPPVQSLSAGQKITV